MLTSFLQAKDRPYREHFPFCAESQAGIQLPQVAGLPSFSFSTTFGIGIALWHPDIDSEGRKWLMSLQVAGMHLIIFQTSCQTI